MSHLPPQRPQTRTPYGPLQRRLLGLTGFLAVLMIGLIVFHALHTGSTGLNAVAEAAERTARQPGAKLAIEVRYGAEGSSTSIVGNGSGRYDAHSGRSLSDLSVPVPGHGTVRMESVGDERRVFLRSPMFAGELPPDKEWLGMEPLLGHDAQTALGGNGSPESELQVLKAVGGDVEKLDQQTVRGHLTTRYKGTVELAKAAQIFSEDGEESLAREYEEFAERIPGPVPVEVWIDDHGLAREFRIVEPIPTSSGTTVTMDMRVQFYAFGRQPKIKLPPKRKVLDFTPVLRAELGLEDGSTVGPLGPPAGAKPLSVAAFHQRVRGFCRGVLSKARTISDGGAGLMDRIKALGPSGTRSAEGHELISAYGTRVVEPIYWVVHRETRKLVSVDPPPSLAAEYSRYLAMDAKSVEWSLAQTRMLELGTIGLPALKARRAEAKVEKAERAKLASTLGISVCEANLESSGSASESSTSE